MFQVVSRNVAIRSLGRGSRRGTTTTCRQRRARYVRSVTARAGERRGGTFARLWLAPANDDDDYASTATRAVHSLGRGSRRRTTTMTTRQQRRARYARSTVARTGERSGGTFARPWLAPANDDDDYVSTATRRQRRARYVRSTMARAGERRGGTFAWPWLAPANDDGDC